MRSIICVGAAALAVAACSSANGGEGEAQPAEASSAELSVTPIAEDLAFPWGLAVLPDGSMLVTEREGFLKAIKDGALVETPIAGGPEAYVEGQGGYLGLALDPDFAVNRTLYLSYSSGNKEANRTTVVRAEINNDLTELTNVQEIFRGAEKGGAYHFGGQLEFMTDGTLLVALGDGFKWMDDAQTTGNYFGKIARINTDGTIPEDNPFASGDAPAVYSYGHRNVQGLEVNEVTGTVWAHEHGPKGGDELNLIEPANNYGWPKITYGVNYNGSIITTETEAEGMEQPKVKWVPSIAPSGMVLYTGDKYPGWQGDLFVGGMNGPAGLKLVRIDLDGDEVVGTEDLLVDENLPIRAVVQGTDGYIYIATHDVSGGVYRIDVN